MCKKQLAVLFSLFLYAIPLHSYGYEADSVEESLPSQQELDYLLESFNVPGVSITELQKCEVGKSIVAGQAQLKPDVKVIESTAFEAASLSKPVFAYLVLTLVDKGVIFLDQPIAESFSYSRIKHKDYYSKITPRMVLSHRTGLPNWVGQSVEFYERTTEIPFGSVPNEEYSYSGEAYQLLQAFVEMKTKKTLQDIFVSELGEVMPDSTFAQPIPDSVVASRGYKATSEGDTGRDMTNLYVKGMAASSLVTTSKDYARFLSHICHERGLSPELYKDMLTPQSPVPAGESPFPTSWGLGWMISTMGDETFIGHGGNNDEYRALAGFIKENGDGIVILTNGYHGEAMINAMMIPETQ